MEQIRELIKSREPNIDELRLKYFTNYFYVLKERKILSDDITLESLIDNALIYATKIEFYGPGHFVYNKNGADTKGLRDPVTKVIYVREDLDDVLKEITIYHELHHAVQTNKANDQVGINQEFNVGRLIMEGQTQWFAEEVYKQIHEVQFEEKNIPTENLRMLSGGTVVSNLHNYEMYDAMISKLSIILNVPKDFFVTINYMYEDDKGLRLLEEKYNDAYKKYNLQYDFWSMMRIYDYVYCTDLLCYVENTDKEVVLSGNETKYAYDIHSNFSRKISLGTQQSFIESFDKFSFVGMLDYGGNYVEFSKYIISNELREVVKTIVTELEPKV